MAYESDSGDVEVQLTHLSVLADSWQISENANSGCFTVSFAPTPDTISIRAIGTGNPRKYPEQSRTNVAGSLTAIVFLMGRHDILHRRSATPIQLLFVNFIAGRPLGAHVSTRD